MGGGASLLSNESLKDLTDEEKCSLLEKMRLKYDELTPSIHERNNATDEIIIKELETILEDETKKVKQKRRKSQLPANMLSSASAAVLEVGLMDKEIGDVNQLMAKTRSLSDLNADSPSIKIKKSTTSHTHSIDNEFQDNKQSVMNKTSMDLISTLEQSIDNKEMIANFVKKLKDEKLKKLSSEFRARRLTFDAHDKVETDLELDLPEEYEQVVSPVDSMRSPSGSMRSPSKLTKRTSVFSSGELGVQQEKEPPFPIDNLGTYSCHGVEPDPTSDDGLHQKINQDRGCIAYPYNGSYNEALFLVLDGHGEAGDKISEFVMKQIVVSLEKHQDLVSDPIKALKETFTKTNTALMVTNIPYMKSGTTCVGVYIRGSKMFVANVGDSRAVMAVHAGDGVMKALDLSKDHKPDDPNERKRIEEWGGYVMDPPEQGLSARVYLDPEFTMIGLAMARSIGDYAVKEVGVIPEPDVIEYEIKDDYKFMILASDGVWEFISSQEAIDIVNDQIEFGCHAACEELIQVAAMRWAEEEGDYRDDITAVVIQFPLPLKEKTSTLTSNKSQFNIKNN